MTKDYEDLPLVYSCSGWSSAAQMANDLAVKLDREHHAEMSCIAGVGGDVGPLVETADGGFEWEIPVQLIRGHPAPVDVPNAALINPGQAIHFRASEAMIDGPTCACYAMTTDRLEQLTG